MCAYNLKCGGMGILWASVQSVHCKHIHPHAVLHNWQNLCLPTSCLHFFPHLFYQPRQNKIKPPSCFQQRQWSCEVWGFLWLVRLLNLRKGSDLNVQQMHWEACFIFICCHLVDPYNVIFYFSFWWPLVWLRLVLEYCCFKDMSEFSSFTKILQFSYKICLWLPVSKRLFSFGMRRLLSFYCTKNMLLNCF